MLIMKTIQIITIVTLVGIVICHNDTVNYIPGIGVPKTNTYSGYVTVNETYGANLFYLFWEAQNITSSTPLVMWLNGGPGCSSLFGSFIENGPYLIDDEGTLTENPYSWNIMSHLLYVDQPVGTGYSYVENRKGYVTNEDTMALDVLKLLSGFFELHPEYSKQDFYIFGESYAGKYIPTIASYLLKYSDIKLKAIGIGDGWVDPYIQSSSYCPYLKSKNLVTQEVVDQQMHMYQRYLNLSYNGENIRAELVTYEMLFFCSIQGGFLDVYDIKYPLLQNPTNGPSKALEIYLNGHDVMKAFNANHTYKSCDKIPYIALSEDFNLSVKSLVKDLLNNNLPILLYSGSDDLICNYIGTELWMSTINWYGQSNFDNTTFLPWYINDSVVGSYKNSSGLTYYLIYDAGHMVPFFQPEISLIMFQKYLLSN